MAKEIRILKILLDLHLESNGCSRLLFSIKLISGCLHVSLKRGPITTV